MARTLAPSDRSLLTLIRLTRQTQRLQVNPSGPRWTHPLARLMALTLGFDPDSGADLVVENAKDTP